MTEKRTIREEHPDLPLHELRWLSGIAAQMGAAASLADLATHCEQVFERFAEFDYNGLYLYDLDGTTLRLLYAHGFDEKERAAAEATALQRHPGIVMRTGRILEVPDTREETGPEASSSSPRRVEIRSRLWIPVAHEGEVFGAFGFASKTPRAFDEYDRDLLAYVARLAAIAYRRIRAESVAQREQARVIAVERAATRHRFASFLEAVPDAVVCVGVDGRIMYWNRGAASLFGHGEDAAIGQTLDMIIPRQLRDAHNAGMERHLADGSTRVIGRPVELIGLHADGRELPVELLLSRVDDQDGTYFVGVVRDISARKSAEAERARDTDDERRFAHALLELSRLGDEQLPRFLQNVTEVVARALSVARVSVWRWHADTIVCADLFEAAPGQHTSGMRLVAQDFAPYFDPLRVEDTIAADDAHSHPATSCFTEVYLKPLGIVSMLDVPMRSIDGLRGVICVESLAHRAWRTREVRFCAEVASLVVQALDRVMRRRLENRHEVILASVAEAVIACDTSLLVTVMNPVAETLCGRSAASATGSTLREVVQLVDRTDRRPLADEIESALLGNKARRVTGEAILIHRDGHEFPVAFVASPILEEDVLRGLVLTLRDLAAEVASQRALDERTQRIRSLSEAIPDLLFSVTRDGRLRLLKKPADDADASDLAVPHEEVERHLVADVLGSDAAARFDVVLQLALASGELQTFVYELGLAKGKQIFEARVARMSDDEATVIVRNITEERRRAQELRAQNDRLAALLSSTSAIIYSARLPDFSLQYASDSLVEVLGFARDSMHAPGFRPESIHPEDRARVAAGIDELLRSGRLLHEYRHAHRDGGYRWLRDDVRIVYDDAHNAVGLVGASFDITARRADEARLSLILALQQIVAQLSNWFLAARGMPTDVILREALDALGSQARADRAFVIRVDDDHASNQVWHAGGHTDVRAGRSSELLAELRHVLGDLSSGASVRIPSPSRSAHDDNGRDARTHRPPLLFAVPMIIDGALRGVVGLDAPRVEPLEDNELTSLLQLLADAVAAGLKRSEDEAALRGLTTRLTRRGEQQRILLDLSTSLARATDLEEIFAVLQTALPHMLGVDHLSITKEFEAGRFRRRSFDREAGTRPGIDRALATDELVTVLEGSSVGAAMRTGAPLSTHDHPVAAFSDWMTLHTLGLRQFIVVPLVGPRGPFGAIVLGGRGGESWGIEELSWAMQFGVLVGGHLSLQLAGEALQRMNDDLEQRVVERTRELQASEERFELLFQNAPQAMILVDERGRIVQSNVGAQALFGYDAAALEGLALSELVPRGARERHEGHVEHFNSRIARTMAPARPVRGLRRDQTEFEAEIGLVPISFQGRHQVVAGISDISARVAAQTALTSSLREKETLLKEIHHRVKNNLQIISSLLMLQSEQMPSPDAQAMMRESVFRVRSMALIHQQFYGVESLERIDVGGYARGLAMSLSAVLAPGAKVDVVADEVTVPVDMAVPLGLILNELITNAFKYGLPRTQAGGGPSDIALETMRRADVLIEVRPNGDRLMLAVSDCGPGLPPGFEIGTSTSLGLQLVRSLTKQLRGKLNVSSQGGARFELSCPLHA